jgi:ubiquitin-protein ligase
MANWWGTRHNVSKRLRLEVEAMRVTFGDTFRLVVPRQGTLYWTGQVDINITGIPQREHMVKILYPPDYPVRPPEAYVLKPYIYSHKHQFEDGQLCLFNPKDGTTYGWNPSRSTAVTVAGWAIQWLYAYYTWKQIGVWPGEEERIKKSFLRGRRREDRR